MRTKYIRQKSGEIVIFSELSGVEHFSMARQLGWSESVSDAGFVYFSEDFRVYGSSVSLGIASNQYAAIDLSHALKDGKLKLVPLGGNGAFYATNQTVAGKAVDDVDDLYQAKILLS